MQLGSHHYAANGAVARALRSVFLKAIRLPVRQVLAYSFIATSFVFSVATAEEIANLETQRVKADSDLQELQSEIVLTKEKLASLENEISKLKKDQATISAALIQSAKTDKKLQQDILDIGERLVDLREQEDSIRSSLRARRAVLAEVLAALQRMGLNPPPAIMVRPDDALASVRSAVLLGAVVPEMRQQADELLDDLTEMQRLAHSIEAEKNHLITSRQAQAEEQERQKLLLEEKKKLQSLSESEMAQMQQRSEELASKATSLQSFIAELDAQMEGIREAADDIRRKEAERLAKAAELAGQPVPDSHDLMSMSDFSSLKGRLVRPAAGTVRQVFGSKNEIGAVSSGEWLETAPKATITSPSDGVVLYAGLFRSYGQLLILDAGSGYHIVMAGMGRINVSQGQFVLAGEPVGSMGEQLLASAVTSDIGDSAPTLYIEFRKDGKPVDPAPWWTERLPGRTEHDT